MTMAEMKNSVWASKLQKIPLVFKFSSLHEALTNDEISVPGYIFDETNKTSFQSDGVCDELMDFILLTFETTNPIQKLKALKVLRHLTVNGNINFREKLKKCDRMIKEANGFNGPYDAIHGYKLNETIRSESTDLMNLLFKPVTEDERDRHASLQLGNTHSFTGMGSSHHTGKYEGFGSSPIVPNKTVVDKVVDGINTMVDRIMTTTDNNEIIHDALKVDSGDYHAIHMPTEDPIFPPRERLPLQISRHIPTSTHLKRHVPGRAGGGWDDDDSAMHLKESDINSRSATRNDRSSPSRMSADSLETDNKIVPEIEESTYEEKQLVDEVLAKLASSKSFLELEMFCRRCTTLDCEKLLDILHGKLNIDNGNTNLAVLIFVEALLYQDVVPAESLRSIFGKSLELLAHSNANAVNIKSKKVLLILNKLIDSSAA